MNRSEAKELLNIIKAFAEGKVIQLKTVDKGWQDIHSASFDSNPKNYRIKPEPKYRPFKSAEECWQKMLKHQPFGWVKDRDGDKTFIGGINSDNTIFMCNSEILYLKDAFENFTFIEGTPFGIEKEE